MRGISPILATLIVVIITIILSVVFIQISHSTISTISTEPSKAVQTLLDTLRSYGVSSGKSILVVRMGSFVDPNKVAEITSLLSESGFRVSEVDISQLDVKIVPSKQLVILVGPLDPSKFTDIKYTTTLNALFDTVATSGVPLLYLYPLEDPAIEHIGGWDRIVGFTAINIYKTMKQPNAFVLRYPIQYISTNPAETADIETIYTEVGAASKQVHTLLLANGKLLVGMYPAETPRLLVPIQLKVSSSVGTITTTDPTSAVLYASFTYRGYDIFVITTTGSSKIGITDVDAMHPSVYSNGATISNANSLFNGWRISFDDSHVELRNPSTGEVISVPFMRIPANALLPPGGQGTIYPSSTMYINDFRYFSFVLQDNTGSKYLILDRNSDGYFDVEVAEERNEQLLEGQEFWIKYFEYLTFKVSKIDLGSKVVTIDLIGIGGKYGTATLASVVETTYGRARIISAPLFFTRQNENTVKLLGVLIARLLK